MTTVSSLWCGFALTQIHVALLKIMKGTSRKHFYFFSPLFSFCRFQRWRNDRHPFYFNVHRMSVGWVMSQLSLAAEVVWLLELTATKRPNSAVMSMAEEAGITHFKTLLQRWAHSVYCFRRTWDFYRSLPSPYKVIVHHPKSVLLSKHGESWIRRNPLPHEESTSGKAERSSDRTDAELSVLNIYLIVFNCCQSDT